MMTKKAQKEQRAAAKFAQWTSAAANTADARADVLQRIAEMEAAATSIDLGDFAEWADEYNRLSTMLKGLTIRLDVERALAG